MLTQAKSPYGRTSVEAMSVPSSGAEIPQPCPISSIRRQSASFWFQLADLESAKQPAMCSRPSGCSVLAIPSFEMRRLAEALPAVRHPFGHPVDHGVDWHSWGAEEALRVGDVDEPRRLRLLSGERRFFRE